MRRPKPQGGYRSGLEKSIGDALRRQAVEFEYEATKISYTKPTTKHKYTPDFILPHNGIVIEAKGIFVLEDRKKHLLVREQNPDYDIRFVFGNAHNKLYKGSKTTYADWCNKNNFKWAHKEIPQSWLK